MSSGGTSTEYVPSPEEQERQKERQQQLDNLKAAVPKSHLKGMRATIQTNTYRRADGEHRFSVDMILELTETERAIIKQYELDDIVLEDIALYTQEDFERKQRDIEKHERDFERSTFKGQMLKHKIAGQVEEMVLKDMKRARRVTKLGNLLVVPYSRDFGNPHDAADYASTLKTDYLPKMKQLIERASQHKQSETLEF